jgi:hypothetical protein
MAEPVVADPGAAYHAAQDAALRGSAALAAFWPGGVARIYGVVPHNAPLPYIITGDDQILEDSDECVSASEINANVHVWTKPEPPDVQLGRQIAGQVRAILADEALVIAGFDLVMAQFVDTRHVTSPDGSSHAVLGFRYLVTASP